MLGILLRSVRTNTKAPLSCTVQSSSAATHTASQNLNSRQRRHSSSKPSSPSNDNSSTIATTPAAKDVTSGTRKRSSSKGGRSRSREGATKLGNSSSQSTVPSVPSTQHLHSQDVTLASFFSLHRPISVIAPVPPTSTDKAFAAIFSSSAKRTGGELPFTLSSAVGNPSLKAIEQQATNDLRSAVTQASPANAESVQGDANSIYINVDELAKNFRPFQPPPPPEPIGNMTGSSKYRNLTANSTSVASEVLALTNGAREQPLRAILPFFQRMQIRQIRWSEKHGVLQNSIWHAISVKRQRKLKMKKHKYKKLMKRTRNLRRKQDRL